VSGLDAKLDQILRREQELQHLMSSAASEDYARIGKELAELAPVVEGIRELRATGKELAELEAMLEDAALDKEMRELAEVELEDVRARLAALDQRVRLLLLPQDMADERSAILEIRAGTGGEEAALFAADLFRMYQRYAEGRGWRIEVLSLHETGLGGLREVTASVTGQGVFARLKFEAGVHRVQRVPATEAQGRIHTSAATVAVLPEAEEVDVQIDDKDLRIDVFRSSGPGGQSVNTTDSAVRITHLPTGIVVSQQDEKSQHKNKAKAMRVLRARLLDKERQEREAARASDRKGQIGTGDRSERIRTYNFPQNRLTDHRIDLTLHKLDRVVTGEALDEVIDALIAEDQAARLAEAV
jgi:peptide chain release factor 1